MQYSIQSYICFLFLFASILLLGCIQGKENIPETKKEGNQVLRIKVYVYEDENDPDNLNEIHVGDITNKGGKLELSIVTPGEAASKLQKAFVDITSRKSLRCKEENPKRIDGRIVYVLTRTDVAPDPKNSRYIWAIADALNGFICNVVYEGDDD